MQENTAKRPVKVLFVCSANMDRSPTAENLFKKNAFFSRIGIV
jgi:protein-tyrosine-phosphatase